MSDTKNLDFFSKLSYSDKLLVSGKSFRWLVNQIRENPQKYTRIVMQALNDPKMGLFDRLNIKKSDRDYIFSMHKGFFDPDYKNSIRAIQNTQRHNAK